MIIEQRILKFVTFSNWILLLLSGVCAFFFLTPGITKGIIAGGLIVTINFHLLYKTLKKAFTPPQISSHNVVLAKYYVRFTISGIIIFLLISQHVVNPLGLFIGLSVVVVSIILATMIEIKNLFLKEAI